MVRIIVTQMSSGQFHAMVMVLGALTGTGQSMRRSQAIRAAIKESKSCRVFR